MADETFMDWLAHSIQRSLSVYLIGAVVVLVAFGGWTFYRAFLKKAPPTTTIQNEAGGFVDARQFHQGALSCMRIEPIKMKP